MEEKMVTITVEEYKNLLTAAIRIDIFSYFVNESKYSIDREDCGRYLGFEVKEK